MAIGRKIDWSSIFFTNTTVLWRLDDRQAGVQTRSRNHEYDYAELNDTKFYYQFIKIVAKYEEKNTQWLNVFMSKNITVGKDSIQ